MLALFLTYTHPRFGGKARLTPCFHDWVPKTLAPDWVEGAVIPQEAAPNNRWEFNPCSSDGKLQRLYVFDAIVCRFFMAETHNTIPDFNADLPVNSK